MPKRPSVPKFKPPRLTTVNVPGSPVKVPGAPRKRALEPVQSKPRKRPSRTAAAPLRAASKFDASTRPRGPERMGPK
jgi:hypothetical protein